MSTTTYPHDHPLMALLRDVRDVVNAAGIRNATAGIHSRDLDSVGVSVTWSSGPDGRRTPDALEAAGFELTYHTPACRSAWVARRSAATIEAPAELRVTIVGPNLRDQSKGQFVVHAEGCADIARMARRDPAYRDGWTISASSTLEVVAEIHSDFIAENEGDPVLGHADAYRSEVHFAPCCKLPREATS